MSNLIQASQYAGSYNQQEQERIEARFQALEQYVGKADATKHISVGGGQFDLAGSGTEQVNTSGAVLSVTKLCSKIATAGVETRTLAAPAGDGKLKMILMTGAAGNCTIAGTNIQGGAGKNLTFIAVGDCAILISLGGIWIKIGGNAALV